jgi:uncharacterized protein YjbI with pentapeptide repeats
MKSLKPITNEIREKIQKYIKEGLDISKLIENYDIKGLDLSGAIITECSRLQEDLQNTKFIRCTFGGDKKIVNFSSSDLRGCNFSHAKFLGPTWFRATDLRNCNFSYAYIPNVDYQYAQMENINLCACVIRFGGTEGLGCTFSKSVLDKLSKYWKIV